MRKPEIREVEEAFRSLFSPHTAVSLPKEPNVAPPEFNEDSCIGCRVFTQVCSADASEMFDLVNVDPPVRRLVIHHSICIFCGIVN